MRCVDCGSERVVKDGFCRSKQRWNCGNCGLRFVPDREGRRTPPLVAQIVERMVKMGFSTPVIAEACGVSAEVPRYRRKKLRDKGDI